MKTVMKKIEELTVSDVILLGCHPRLLPAGSTEGQVEAILMSRPDEAGYMQVSMGSWLAGGGQFAVEVSLYRGHVEYEPEFLAWAKDKDLDNTRQANAAWLAGQESVLSARGKTAEENMALSVLRGEKTAPLLADYLMDRGLLDGSIAVRLSWLKGLLKRCLYVLRGFSIYDTPTGLVNDVRVALEKEDEDGQGDAAA